MAEYKGDKEAQRNGMLVTTSIAKRAQWTKDNVRYMRMLLTDQWEDEERNYLKKHKRFPIEVNICAPIVDGLVSMIAANSPRFKAIPSTNAGRKDAAVAEYLLEYIAYNSFFPQEFV